MSQEPPLPSKFRVHHLLAFKNYLLLVFYTASHCYEFRVVTPKAKILAAQEIFYTHDSALLQGRDFLLAYCGDC